MPVYEYICGDCDTQFDQLVRSFKDADEVSCQSCSGQNVRRMMSRVAVVGGLDDPITPMRSAPTAGGCCGGSCGCGH